jgi:hypothetical protein
VAPSEFFQPVKAGSKKEVKIGLVCKQNDLKANGSRRLDSNAASQPPLRGVGELAS